MAVSTTRSALIFNLESATTAEDQSDVYKSVAKTEITRNSFPGTLPEFFRWRTDEVLLHYFPSL
jgi:hypothetical protein